MGITLTMKVPKRGTHSLKTTHGSFGTVLSDYLEKAAMNLEVKGIIHAGESMNIHKLYTAAVFFQRVVTRTPVDEPYSYGGTDSVTGKEGTWEHVPDEDYTRNHWRASYGNSVVTAKEITDMKSDAFSVLSDKEDVSMIFDLFYSKFIPRNGAILHNITITNDSDKFSLLEYGEYRKTSSTKKEGEGEFHYEHGITNSHAAHAPRGMLRVTEAEFDEISQLADGKVREYEKLGHRDLPDMTDEQLEMIIPFLKGRKVFRSNDIERIMKMVRSEK